MSLTRAVISNFVFYFLCLFFGFLTLAHLLIQFAFRGKQAVLEVRPRLSRPACLLDPQLGKHNYVKLKDVKLHYVETGDRFNKPLLLCLHGFPDFWYSWRYQLQELQNNFWVVAVDMRGYGDSDKPSGIGSYTTEKIMDDVEQLIVTLGRRSCVLMGHDRGGTVAWMFAEKFPQMVDRLIVLNSAHPEAFVRLLRSSVRQFLKSWFLFFVQLPYLPEIYLRCNDLGFIDSAFQFNANGKRTFCDHDIEAYKYTFGMSGALTGPLNYFRNLRSYIVNGGIEDDMRKAGQVKMPVLIVWGADDSSSLGSRLANMSRDHHVDRSVDCQVRIVKGAGKFVHQQSPDLVNEYIREFLTDVIKAWEKTSESAAGSHVSSMLPNGMGVGVHSLVGRVRDRLVSGVSSSALKLSSKVPVLVYMPVIGQLSQGNGWVSALNRKLLS